MTELDAMLAGIVADPREETRWLVLADWLQEYDDPRRAELLRLHRCMLATCCEPDAHPQRAEWQTRMVELLVAGVKSCVPQETLTLPGGVPMTFAFIPPGAFLMGSDKGEEDEKPVHRVEVEQGFFLGIHTVTQLQWKAVMGTTPSHFKGPKKPVEQVSWNDCQEFCAKLTTHLNGRSVVRLPTEAEWECACRAGTTTHYHFGDVPSADLANYDGSYTWNGSPKGKNRKKTTDVGSFPANPWGLHDLHGNVWEWCADAYAEYTSDDQTNDSSRVVRGGSWGNIPAYCRAAFRCGYAPASRGCSIGFRVCFPPGLIYYFSFDCFAIFSSDLPSEARRKKKLRVWAQMAASQRSLACLVRSVTRIST